MATPPTPDTVEDAARALLDERMHAVRDLAGTRTALSTHRASLTDLERADAAAYAAATRAGWSTDELKRLGFDAPTRRPPGRPRSRTTSDPGAGAS